MTVKAFVVMRTPAEPAELVERLQEIRYVTRAWVVYGEADIIAEIDAPDVETLKSVIVGELRTLPEVEWTRTHLAVTGNDDEDLATELRRLLRELQKQSKADSARLGDVWSAIARPRTFDWWQLGLGLLGLLAAIGFGIAGILLAVT